MPQHRADVARPQLRRAASRVPGGLSGWAGVAAFAGIAAIVAIAGLAALAAPPAQAQPAPAVAPRVNPPDGARDVPRLQALELRFASASEAGDAMHDGIELLGPLGPPVPAVLSRSGSLVRVETALPLAGCTRYRLVLRAAETWSSRFTTRCSRWSEPVQLDDRHTAHRPGLGARDVQVAATPDGSVVAAWFQTVGRHSAILSNRYDPGTDSWQTPRPLDMADAGGAALPALATLASGRVLAGWVQDLHGHAAVLVRVLGESGEPQRLDDATQTSSPTAVQLSADAAGNAVAVWQQPTSGHGAVWASHRDAGSGRWSAPQPLDTAGLGAYAPSLAGAGDDAFVVAWERGPVGHERIAASRWLGKGWSAPRVLSAPALRATRPRVALGGTHHLAVAWIQGDDAQRRLAVRRWQLPAWSGAPARVLDLPGWSGPALAVAMSFDPAGGLTLAWQQQPATARPDAIVAARWPRGAAAPNPPLRLDPAGLRAAGGPTLVSDPAGNLVCAWYQDTAQGLQVLAARYDASSDAWQTPLLLSDARRTVQASLPVLTVDAAGSITAAWQQFNGWREIVVGARLR